jgi:tetratricopeptide (TPR) repeat protein
MTVEEEIAAAYALDREGDETGAIKHYDAAYRMGVPADREKGFFVGYGSTLRNVGRADEAVAILAEAVKKYPDYPALAAFLALALLDAGHPHAAVAAMLGVALDVAPANAFDGYDRALGEYHAELLLKSQEQRRRG